MDRREELDEVVEAFGKAWTEGAWDDYFAMYADEFVFEFPSPPLTGRWSGAEAVEHRDRWRAMFEASRLTTTGEDLRLYDGFWVVSCNHAEGILRGKPHKGLLTTVLHRIDEDGRIVEYREFLGGLTRPVS
ncbi:nuclear transport factor 2 family protein [Streptomyces aculeolatus]